nr:phospholipase-like protein [Ipomoea batatas]
MGFASLFHLQIDNLPTRMGYWLDQNYNLRNNTLYLADGPGVSITEQDVQLVLGFPRGDIKIEKWSRAHSTDLLEEWKGLVDKSARGYLYSDVIKAMLSCEDGVDQGQRSGKKFKPEALVLVESRIDSYMLQKILKNKLNSACNDHPSAQPQPHVESQSLFYEDDEAQVYIANYVEELDLLGKTIVEVIELASKPPAFVRDNEVIKLMHSATQKLLGGGRVTVDSSIQKDVEASCNQDSFWCIQKNIATMDAVILRSEQYLKNQYQDVRAEFTQACSPSSHHQEDEQMEVCEKGAALEERGGGVEVVAEEDVMEERADGVEMVVEKESSLDERVGGVDIAGEKDVLVDDSVDAVGKGCEKDSLVDKSSVAVAAGEERGTVLLGEGEQYVFKSWDTMLMRMELLSLKGHAYVTASVLDSYTVVDPQVDDAGRLKRFKENLHIEFQRVPHIKLSALDLLFFPMIASEHSYVICFNIKSYRIDIIDNSSKSVTNYLKYGSVPSDLVSI